MVSPPWDVLEIHSDKPEEVNKAIARNITPDDVLVVSVHCDHENEVQDLLLLLTEEILKTPTNLSGSPLPSRMKVAEDHLSSYLRTAKDGIAASSTSVMAWEDDLKTA